MAVRKRIEADHATPRTQARSRPRLANSDTAATPSPALELQARLSAGLDQESRWPPVATAGFILVTCSGFWSALAWGVSRLFQ